jgi:predicted ATPase/DNA-binding XRE family transcriptional regulator
VTSDSFGARLKQLRRASNLTQEGLAQRVPCSVELIRKVERDTRRPSAQVALRLADILAIPPEAQAEFIRLARGEQAPLRAATLVGVTSFATSGNLPAPVTSVIGRGHETTIIQDMLARSDVRLVTFTGTAGVGKTCLALHAARTMQPAFADGVWLVTLAPIRAADLVASAIAQVLGVPESGGEPLIERLMTMLRPRQLLLVLDNLEHLLEARTLLSDLLARCPQVKIVTTSRVRLHLYGEWELRVAALELPPTSSPSHSEASTSTAVQLFVARAQAARHEFVLTDTNAPAVVAICHHLGGLPLAIELAAARIRSCSPQDLLAQLSSALAWLQDGPQNVPGRLQSMRAAIAWSYALLDPATQALFRRLGIFIGGWTLDAALAVCVLQDEPAVDTADQLAALCEHQLVQLDGASATASRFAMLEVIREYALEQVQQHGEEQAVRQRHAAYFCALAEQADPHLRRAEQVVLLARLAREQPNMRAALDWCLHKDGERSLGVRLAANLGWFWWLQSQCFEGIDWLTHASTYAASVAPPVQVQLLCMASTMMIGTGDHVQGGRWAEEASRRATAAGDTLGLCKSYLLQSAHHVYQGSLLPARAPLIEALQLAMRIGDVWHIVAVYWNMATLDPQAAQNVLPLDEALRLAEESGDRWNMVGVQLLKSWQLAADGDLVGAIALQERAERAAREIGDRRQAAVAIRSLAHIMTAQGELEQAAARNLSLIQLTHEIGDPQLLALAHYDLGHVRLLQGDAVSARALFFESLERYEKIGNAFGVAISLAGTAALQPSPEQAATLLGSISQAFAASSVQPDPFTKQDYERVLANVRARLDPATFAAAWQKGQALSLEQAVALAVSENSTAVAHSPSRVG